MLRLIFATIFFTFAHLSQAQYQFPDIQGKCLDNSQVNIPSDTKGKMTLVGIAFSKKSEEDLRSWFQPAYRTFISPPTNSLIPVDSYDANLYFIAMLKGLAKGASGKIYKKMQDGIDKQLHPYVLLYDDNFQPYKKALDFGAKDLPYFYVLDPNGKVVYQTSGEYTEEKFDEILSKFDD